MSILQAAFDRAVKLHQSGSLDAAEALYLDVLNADPRHHAALHLLGVIDHQRGRNEQALERIGSAIELDQSQAIYFNNYGAALQSQGRDIEAKDAFHRAVALRPKYADAHSNLGNILERLGQLHLAEESLRHALKLEPNHFDTLRRLGNLFVRMGRRTDAVRSLRRALQIRPANADVLSDLGNCFMAEGCPQIAVPHYLRAINAAPGNATVQFNLGIAYADQDLLNEAKWRFEAACRLDSTKTAWPLRTKILCPSAFRSTDELDQYRADLENEIDVLIADPPRVAPNELVQASFCPPFALAFQGRHNRRLKEKFARLMRAWIETPAEPRGSGGRRRIGFLVTRGHEGVFNRCMAGIIQRLNPRFEVCVACPECSEDLLKSVIGRTDVQRIVFRETVDDAVRKIRDADLDVLYHWEIGTDSLNYILPFYRLAPVQLTSWGTQVTSGIKEIDYYISSSLIETPNTDEHYTERLWRMNGLMTWQARLPVPPRTRKSYFGLPDDRPVYLCQQTVLKLHSEQDPLFADILRRDPHGILVLKEGRYKRPVEIIRERMRNEMPDVFDRVVFIPWQPRDDLYRLISVADVVLDPLHFSAGSSSYDMWSLNQPIVTLPGQLNIGRYTLACYRKMGMLELVADSPTQYVDLAIKMGSDRSFAAEVRQKLADRTPLLFHDHGTVTEHETLFDVLLDKATSPLTRPS